MATHSAYPTLHTLADGSRLCRHPNGIIYHHSRGANGTGRQTTGRKELAEAIDVVRKWEITAARVGAMDAAEFKTFGEIAEKYREWLVRHGKGETQIRTLKTLDRFFGPVPACLINAAKVEEYSEWRRAGHGTRYRVTWKKRTRQNGRGASDGTLYREVSVLERTLSWAVKADILPNAKTEFLKGPNATPREVFLEQDEMDDLLARAAKTSEGTGRLSRIHRFVWLALYTGARTKALEKLEWSQVDFGRKTIQLRKVQAKTSRKRQPTVPIFDDLLPVLVRAQAEAENRFVLGGTGMRAAWDKFISGTPYAARDLHMHDLRRSFITMLVTNGMPLAEITLVYEVSQQVLITHYAKRAKNLGARVQGYVLTRQPAPAVPQLDEAAD